MDRRRYDFWHDTSHDEFDENGINLTVMQENLRLTSAEKHFRIARRLLILQAAERTRNPLKEPLRLQKDRRRVWDAFARARAYKALNSGQASSTP